MNGFDLFSSGTAVAIALVLGFLGIFAAIALFARNYVKVQQ